MRLLLLTPLLAIACKSPTATDPVPGPTDTDPPPTGDTDTDPDTNVPVIDCNAYTYRGVTYDCDAVDRCDNDAANLTSRLACCECDPTLCLADPTCPPPDINTPTPFVPPTPPDPLPEHTSCQRCHNGAQPGEPIYSGTGISNPHPFGSAAYIECTACHGGDGTGGNRIDSHVPAPPLWTDQNFLLQNGDNFEYFNYRTRTGIDKMEPWADPRNPGDFVDPLDYIQFMNPGDIRIVSQGKSCGTCHADHAKWVTQSPLSTEVGFYSTTNFSTGVNNALGYDEWIKTAGDYGHRAVSDPTLSTIDPNQIGRVPQLIEYPEFAQYDRTGGDYIKENFNITAANVQNQVHDGNFAPYEANQVITGSDLEHLIEEVISGACGDCHLNHSGANNRYADFRSSGCTSCHMEYSVDGKSRSTDINVPKNEPFNPDAIAAPERSHVDSHQIRNVAKFLPGGGFVRGVSDYACVGCHQGSNRTVLQYWGIRLDQNADVVNGFQYPANPITFQTTQNDARLYSPAVGNATFNGRNFNQHLLEEDYDDDQRDDTPPDVHYEAGLGCIDCHGSADMHTNTADGVDVGIVSHQSQATYIECESCHGSIDDPPLTTSCSDYNGNSAECAVDRLGNPLRNVTRDAGGQFRIALRVLGGNKFIPLTKDTINSVNVVPNPNRIGQFVYNPRASYAMGRLDGNPATGNGPEQTNPQFGEQNSNFAHGDTLDCNACHSAWTNSCVGCHLTGIYDDNPANYFFSNITGERIVMNFAAEFTYQSPVLDYLTVGTKGKITTGQPGMKMFFKYQDFDGDLTNVLAFTDRAGSGNNPDVNGRGAFGALSHNKIAQHSTRGAITAQYEGTKPCGACHNTVEGLADDFNLDGVTNLEDYITFRDQYDNQDFENLDYALLQTVIGLNTQNYLEHPIKVAMMAGVGSGLFLFDQNGCPVNPLDANANRVYCLDANGDPISPQDRFNNEASFNDVTYDLDRIAEYTGVSNASYSQPIVENLNQVYQLRGGAINPTLAGNLGARLIEDLSDPALGIVLDSWIDAEAAPRGDVQEYQPDIQ